MLCAVESVPAAENGDAYLLRLILHDWSDDDSIAILSSLRQAMGDVKAKLLIVEVLSCPPSPESCQPETWEEVCQAIHV